MHGHYLECPGLVLSKGKSRCAKASHLLSRDLLEDLFGPAQVLSERGRRELMHQQMSMTVARDFMPSSNNLLDDVGALLRYFSHNKTGGFHSQPIHEIEETRYFSIYVSGDWHLDSEPITHNKGIVVLDIYRKGLHRDYLYPMMRAGIPPIME